MATIFSTDSKGRYVMWVSVTLEAPIAPDGEPTGPVTVGWMLTQNAAGLLFDAPVRVREKVAGGQAAKSASRCPAILNFESRYFQVNCPYDMQLGFQYDDDGNATIINLLGDQSPVRGGKLSQLIELSPQNEWRHPERPIIQIKLPYLFLADEPVFLSQVPPFGNYRSDCLPGLMIGGRFPIHVWPRPLMWAFEWHDTDSPISISRGEPMFYVLFETLPQDRSVRLIESQRTPELSTYLEQISGVVNYVNQSFSLFEAAESRRPTKLVVPVTTNQS